MQPVSVWTVICLLNLHFIADFVLQNDWMALNKSKYNKALLAHVATYSACLLLVGPIYALINGAAHFITDYITSRVTSYLWEKKERHWFFVVIGLDQLIHYSTLLLTLSIGRW